MQFIRRLQFHKILLSFNNGIVFGQDNGILANTKTRAKKKPLKNKDNMEWGIWWYVGMWYVVCWYVGFDMLVCGYGYVICWYGGRYCKCDFFGKNQKWTKRSTIRRKYDHIKTLKVWPYNM
jgi:hypothetical protein